MKFFKTYRSHFFICIILPALLTLVGCSTVESKDDIISLQKKRITNMQRHMERQDRTIVKLKAKKWSTRDSQWGKRKGLREVDRRMAKKQWPQALRTSSNLVKKFPDWQTIRGRRVKIYKALGLERLAKREQVWLKNFQAKKQQDPSFSR